MLYGFYFDPTYILIIIGMVLCLAASAHVNSTFNKYSRVRSNSGMTGAQAAQRILESQGIYDVSIRHISGNLTDNYNPSTKVLSLSDATYGSTSVAAIGVAAHECGHAMQHNKGYAPISVRDALVPFANWGSRLSWVLIIIGIIFYGQGTGQTMINIGIFAFSLAVLFQIVTLPVEFNASNRAIRVLESTGIFGTSELKCTKKVLGAAALTYVAAAASSILQLLRLILLFGGRDDD
ncbi:peptidase [Eubacterium sp. AF36-5BH]|jgi:Zn-dependent membrane protease YugP|uniref:zinc metallopeptidase n=1 Tax=Eubacterium TaxID=1730 RepID=UPI000E47391A|nr:zinc metallopeptidase [Eubacterium sp. AF36-5BH]RGF51933.1 peptidase [Eubacterium sp. AF36-5BH]